MANNTKYQTPTPEEMLTTGLHIGHSKRRWHPRTAPFIFGASSGVYLFDLYKVESCLKTAQDFLYDLAKKGGTIVFLGTKIQARDLVENGAKKCKASYITKRWIGGTFSNFEEIKKNRVKLKDLIKGQEDKSFEKYTKKERLLIAREVNKLRIYHEGILEMDKLPDVLFVVDAKREKTAVKEALELGITVVALLDSNTDPTGIKYPIPGNDDAIKSISLVVDAVSSAIQAGNEDRITRVVVEEPKKIERKEEIKKEETKETKKETKASKPAKKVVKKEVKKEEKSQKESKKKVTKKDKK